MGSSKADRELIGQGKTSDRCSVPIYFI